MALSPFPAATATITRAAAIAKIRRVVSGLDDERAAELGETAAALIEDYAPGAPQAVKDEAALRFVGYMKQSPVSTISKIDVGSIDIEYSTTNHAAMFRHCGAAALLTRWKVRRGGVIG